MRFEIPNVICPVSRIWVSRSWKAKNNVSINNYVYNTKFPWSDTMETDAVVGVHTVQRKIQDNCT